MAASEPNQSDELLGRPKSSEERSWLPWIIAGVIVVGALIVFSVLGRNSRQAVQPGGAGMAPPAPYAGNLPISGVQMSQADSFSGAKVTYIDGQIENTGTQTVTAITVQIGFRNDLGQLAQRTVTPLNLIRTRNPYVDVQPVSAAPIRPGEKRDFRLIFDNVPPDWNQQYPEIRVIASQGH